MSDTAPTCAPFDPRPRAPRFVVPAGAVDCHAHVFGPAHRYPYAAGRLYNPPDATLQDYRALLKILGVTRGVLVQPSVYGFDNSLLIDALMAAGPNFRGVAVVEPDCSDDDLDLLHAAGVRGLRFNPIFGGGAAIEQAQMLAKRIEPRGWHLQFLIDVSVQHPLAEFIGSFELPVVIDHMGHMPAARGITDPGFQTLLALLKARRCWVKLSGSYRLTGQSHPPYDDILPLASALVAAAPDRCLWATDWPHPQIAVPMPNDGDLMDQLPNMVPDRAVLDRILVDNPARLYEFS